MTSQGHSEGKSEDGERSKAAEVEEEALGPVRGAGFNCLTGKLRHEHLDEVRRMQQARELDRIRNPEREDREVVVDVVEHAKKQ
jgi:hypothetical protein